MIVCCVSRNFSCKKGKKGRSTQDSHELSNMNAFEKPTNSSEWSNHYDVTRFEKSGEQSLQMLTRYLGLARSQELDFVLPSFDPGQRLDMWSKEMNAGSDKGNGLFRDDLLARVLDRSNHLHDPRYAGHQVAVPLPELAWISAATALLNNGMAIDEMGPASSPMEEAVMRSIAQFMGLGEGASGILCHGGTLANLTALLAARQCQAENDEWRDGTSEPYAVLVSEQAHYCVDRAVRVMGWGEQGTIHVPTDDQHQIRPESLKEAFAEAERKGLKVLSVVGSACTTSSGAFDDLNALADFAESKDLWFHVDGAHGAAQVFSKQHSEALSGLHRADSVAMDFHKMLGVPALCTGLFYRRSEDAYCAFSQRADYLYEKGEQDEWWNLSKRTFECTKRMLSVAVFGIWEQHGPKLWESLVDQLVGNAQTFAANVEKREGWQLFTHPKSNIVCFRSTRWDNSLLRRLMVEHGPHYIVKTEFNGETWLRCTFQNPFTTETVSTSILTRLEALGMEWDSAQNSAQ
jgi:L-2,4-diaminobutyrate decarboxylase